MRDNVHPSNAVRVWSRKGSAARKALLVAIALPLATVARADIGWSVSFDDPTGAYASVEGAISANLVAAGNAWGSHLVGNTTVDVRIRFVDGQGANGGSSTVVYDHTRADGTTVYQQGAASKIITGIDPNGSGSDIVINLGKDSVDGLFWWDPHPTLRTDPVPGDRLDGLSVLMHELGHGLAFNGFLNGTNGDNPGYMSMYDEHVSFDGSNLFFNGANAEAAYGGPVPLTYGNYAHYGNGGGRPGQDLAGVRLMNGVTSLYGYRWSVTSLDLGFLADTGYTLRAAPVPEPTPLAALGLGSAALLRRRRRGRASHP